jgi:hypothetical protein
MYAVKHAIKSITATFKRAGTLPENTKKKISGEKLKDEIQKLSQRFIENQLRTKKNQKILNFNKFHPSLQYSNSTEVL